MHLIVYLSDYNGPADQVDDVLEDIVRVAKRENMKRDITGVLFFVQNKFLQIIEGQEGDLRQLMKNIAADPRHGRMEYLIDTKVESKGFRQWNMDSFRLDAGRTFDTKVLRELTESFKQSLMPRSNTLVFYYQTLLNQQPA